ncbi:MAG: hypothetical protein ACKVP5_17745 [Aestuariivirga sp.]
MKIGRDAVKWLRKKAKKGATGYPVGTVAFYGPDNSRASKLVAAIVAGPDEDADPLRRWFSEDRDLRADETILEEVAEFFRASGIGKVSMADRIIGCPHEEGIDYPHGQSCPQCPFWANRDRFTHEIVH